MALVNREKEALLTQEYLKSILHYDSETGIFTWLKVNPHGSRVHIGDIAGYSRKDNYVQIRVNGILYFAHRLAWLYMTGSWPEFVIDHIEGVNIPNFNKFSNLRDIKQIKNMWNTQKLLTSNTSGYRGVSFCKANGKYVAHISVYDVIIHLGYFNTPEEASEAYKDAKLKYHKK